MLATVSRLSLVTAVLLSALVMSAPAQAKPVAGDCSNDVKGVGPTLLSTDDAKGTWWRLTREGLEAAGIVGDAAQEALIETVFGVEFGSLAEAVDVLVGAVESLDKNGNGYVCPSRIRGTIGNVTLDEGWQNYFFSVHDDQHVKG